MRTRAKGDEIGGKPNDSIADCRSWVVPEARRTKGRVFTHFTARTCGDVAKLPVSSRSRGLIRRT